MTVPHKIFLSRRNLLTLLSKLDRAKKGEDTKCSLIKEDNKHPLYSQTMDCCIVTALEDEAYYIDREPGLVNPKDI